MFHVLDSDEGSRSPADGVYKNPRINIAHSSRAYTTAGESPEDPTADCRHFAAPSLSIMSMLSCHHPGESH